MKPQARLVLIAVLLSCAGAARAETLTGTVEVDATPITDRLDRVEARLDAHDAELSSHDQRLTDLEEAATTPGNPGTPDPTDPPIPPDPVDPPPPAPGGFWGMNVASMTYYETAWTFADIGRVIDWREDPGRPGYAYTAGHPPDAPGTDYVATWDGSGTLSFTQGMMILTRGQNTATVRVRPDAKLLEFKRDGEVRNVHMLPVGYDGGSSFNPLFVERLRPFKVIRFMDWQRTNNAGPRTWSTRVLPQDSQITDGGVALEYMVELCNELGADPWFAIPHRAEPDYVERLAKLCRDKLHPGASVFVEWSNEVWNTQFSQGQWLADMHNTTLRSDKWFDAWASESKADFDAFSSVLGADRVRRVIGVQAANVWYAQKLVPRMTAAGGFDVLSPSAYFDLTSSQRNSLGANVSVDELADLLEDNITGRNAGWYQQHAALIQGLPGVSMKAYEGNSHCVPVGVALPFNDTIKALRSSPRMKQLILLNAQTFRDAGGDMIAAYNLSQAWNDRYGTFGHLDYMDQPVEDAPPYQAVTE